MSSEWSLAIHGGAGLIRGDSLAFPAQTYIDVLTAAANAGGAVLASGGSAVDAVVEAVKVMEDAPCFNAGRGAVLNRAGCVEMDASIMDGFKDVCGAATRITNIKNPISVAREIMYKSPHCFLSGPVVSGG